MRSALRIVAFACAVVLLGASVSGCGTTTDENAGLMGKALRGSQARLHIYRAGAIGPAVAADVRIDDRKVASLGVGGSTVLDVPAGSRKIVVGGWSHPNEYTLTLNAKAGSVYTLEIAIREEAMVAGMFGLAGMMIEAAANENGGVFQIRVVDTKPARR